MASLRSIRPAHFRKGPHFRCSCLELWRSRSELRRQLYYLVLKAFGQEISVPFAEVSLLSLESQDRIHLRDLFLL